MKKHFSLMPLILIFMSCGAVISDMYDERWDGLKPGYKVTFTAEDVSFNMAFVSGRTFPSGLGDSVTASVSQDFWIGETEVTYVVWKKVYDWAVLNGYAFTHQGRQGSAGTDGGAVTNQQPVANLSWRDCLVWCNALTEWYNAKKGKNLVCAYTYSGSVVRNAGNATACDNAVITPGADGFRIQSKYEWELAARWRFDSHNSVDGFTDPYFTMSDSASGGRSNYYSSPETMRVAVYNASATGEVKSRAPNDLGLYDMSGNLWEWCFDLDGSNRNCRGGSFELTHPAAHVRVGATMAMAATFSDANFGFRIARWGETGF